MDSKYNCEVTNKSRDSEWQAEVADTRARAAPAHPVDKIFAKPERPISG